MSSTHERPFLLPPSYKEVTPTDAGFKGGTSVALCEMNDNNPLGLTERYGRLVTDLQKGLPLVALYEEKTDATRTPDVLAVYRDEQIRRIHAVLTSSGGVYQLRKEQHLEHQEKEMSRLALRLLLELQQVDRSALSPLENSLVRYERLGNPPVSGTKIFRIVDPPDGTVGMRLQFGNRQTGGITHLYERDGKFYAYTLNGSMYVIEKASPNA
jgi:hypothetical protein